MHQVSEKSVQICSKDSIHAQSQSLNQKTVIHGGIRMYELRLLGIADAANLDEKCAGRCG